MLEAKNINLKIDGSLLLKNISLKVGRGSFVCVAGANGSGKTLLLKVLGGVLKPSEGGVFLEGGDINALSVRQRSGKVRFLPSKAESVFNYKVNDIVLMGTNPYIEWWRDYGARDKQAAAEAMGQTGTLELKERGINTLSDGEMQRVFIAQALSGAPSLILPDEPTSHLDLKQKDTVFKLFKNISAQGSIIICATHDIDMAKKYATHLCLLEKGFIHSFGPVAGFSDGKINSVYGL